VCVAAACMWPRAKHGAIGERSDGNGRPGVVDAGEAAASGRVGDGPGTIAGPGDS